MNLKEIGCRILLLASLVLLAASLLFPWFTKSIISPPTVNPPMRANIQFWPYQIVSQQFYRSLTPTRVSILRFPELWYMGGGRWFLIFSSQLLAVGSSLLGLVKPRVRNTSPFGVFFTLVAIVFGYVQFLQLQSGFGFSDEQVAIGFGFYAIHFAFLLTAASTLFEHAR